MWQAAGIRQEAAGIRQQAVIRHQTLALCDRWQASDMRQQASDSRRQASDIRHQVLALCGRQQDSDKRQQASDSRWQASLNLRERRQKGAKIEQMSQKSVNFLITFFCSLWRTVKKMFGDFAAGKGWCNFALKLQWATKI